MLPHGLRIALDALEVRVLEAARILEAVAEQAVETDVRGPDQGDLDSGIRVPEDSRNSECNWQRIRVRAVVRQRAEPRAAHVADRREIRCEEEHDEQEPAVAGVE